MATLRRLLLVLIASFAALLIPSEAATTAEIRAALVQARSTAAGSRYALAATNLLKLLTTQAGKKFFRYNLSPTTTILLPSTWCMVGYKFRKFKPAQTVNIFNNNMLYGKYTFAQLASKPVGSSFKTSYTGRALRKVPAKIGKTVQLRVGGTIQGPRYECECLTYIASKDLYIGKRVAVHGVSCLLTPADYKGGPYGRPGLGDPNNP